MTIYTKCLACFAREERFSFFWVDTVDTAIQPAQTRLGMSTLCSLGQMPLSKTQPVQLCTAALPNTWKDQLSVISYGKKLIPPLQRDQLFCLTWYPFLFLWSHPPDAPFWKPTSSTSISCSLDGTVKQSQPACSQEVILRPTLSQSDILPLSKVTHGPKIIGEPTPPKQFPGDTVHYFLLLGSHA